MFLLRNSALFLKVLFISQFLTISSVMRNLFFVIVIPIKLIVVLVKILC